MSDLILKAGMTVKNREGEIGILRKNDSGIECDKYPFIFTEIDNPDNQYTVTVDGDWGLLFPKCAKDIVSILNDNESTKTDKINYYKDLLKQTIMKPSDFYNMPPRRDYPFESRHVVFINAIGGLSMAPADYCIHIDSDSTTWHFFPNYLQASDYVKQQTLSSTTPDLTNII